MTVLEQPEFAELRQAVRAGCTVALAEMGHGNRQFEFYVDQDDPLNFLLYEEFVDEAALQAHRELCEALAVLCPRGERVAVRPTPVTAAPAVERRSPTRPLTGKKRPAAASAAADSARAAAEEWKDF